MIFNLSPYEEQGGKRFICVAKACSETEAINFEAMFRGPVRRVYPMVELRASGTEVFIDSPDRNIAIRIAKYFNDSQR